MPQSGASERNQDKGAGDMTRPAGARHAACTLLPPPVRAPTSACDEQHRTIRAVATPRPVDARHWRDRRKSGDLHDRSPWVSFAVPQINAIMRAASECCPGQTSLGGRGSLPLTVLLPHQSSASLNPPRSKSCSREVQVGCEFVIRPPHWWEPAAQTGVAK